MNRKPLHDNIHLTLDDRRIIYAGITNSSTKSTITKTIGRPNTTAAKKIKKHRIFKDRNMEAKDGEERNRVYPKIPYAFLNTQGIFAFINPN